MQIVIHDLLVGDCELTQKTSVEVVRITLAADQPESVIATSELLRVLRFTKCQSEKVGRSPGTTAYRPGNRVVTGSTRCGKTTAEVIEIIAAAIAGMAVVCLDPHASSLAWEALIQLVAHGMEGRVLYDRLSETSRVLGYRFLRRSPASDPWRRASEEEQSLCEFIDVLLRRRDLQSIASHPLIEAFLLDALKFVMYQRSNHRGPKPSKGPSILPTSTSASPGSSCPSSPAERLRTAQARGSPAEVSFDESAQSP